jgi:hypothetical protein
MLVPVTREAITIIKLWTSNKQKSRQSLPACLPSLYFDDPRARIMRRIRTTPVNGEVAGSFLGVPKVKVQIGNT